MKIVKIYKCLKQLSNLKISTQLGHTEQPSRSSYLPLNSKCVIDMAFMSNKNLRPS